MQQSSGQPDPAELNAQVIPLAFAELELRFAGVADPEALMPQAHRASDGFLGSAWRGALGRALRHSSRQNVSMQMGGLMGSFTMRGCDIAPFWPFIHFGQCSLVGKGTSFGLGRYRVASLPNAWAEQASSTVALLSTKP